MSLSQLEAHTHSLSVSQNTAVWKLSNPSLYFFCIHLRRH